MTPDIVDDDNSVETFEFSLDGNNLLFINDKVNDLTEYYTNKQIGEAVGANIDDMEIIKAALNIHFKRVN